MKSPVVPALVVLLACLLWWGPAAWGQATPAPVPAPPAAASDTDSPTPAAVQPGAGSTVSSEPPADAAPERSLAAEVIEKVRAAKWIGYILIAMSVVGIAYAIERLVHLTRRRFAPKGLAPEALRLMLAGEFEKAQRLCDERSSILAQVIRSMVKHRDFAFADIGTVADDIVSREVRQELQRAYPMAVVATLAPLLGLLGTVIGMINSFEAVALAGSMGDPSVMAADISFALVTTAMGLIVAAPNLALYHFFRMRTNALTAGLDEQVSELVSDWQIGRMKRNGAVAAMPSDEVVTPRSTRPEPAPQPTVTASPAPATLDEEVPHAEA